MKKFQTPVLLLTLLSLTLSLMISCSRVPLTGRRQVKLLPETELVQMSLAAYNDFLQENQVVEKGTDAEMVDRVGRKLAQSVTDILRQEGMEERLATLKWEFNLVQDDLANAWAMPGGKVVIYTGILPITKTETGLAVVMGHELAHAIAQHGNERMSQGLLAEAGMVAVDIGTYNKSEEMRQSLFLALGLGSQLGVILPFSRKHESEADEMGLIFMAHAGYDPSEAVQFWTRMNAGAGASTMPEFLSTHPSHESRIEDIRTKYLPVAMTYYQSAKTRQK